MPAIVFEDEDLLVLDKPGNLVCHSAQRPGQSSLADWVRGHGVTPRFVNRLDRETSGLVLVTKNERAAKILGKQVLRRELKKEYIAICWGMFAEESGRIDQAIAVTKDSPVYTKRVVDAAGQASVTEFEVVKRLNGFTVVRLKPLTGRTHQLRVHMNWLGHPIVGDKVYGPDERLYLEFIEKGVTDEMLKKLLMPRHALHAARLGCRHPSSQDWITFDATMPEDMMKFIKEHE